MTEIDVGEFIDDFLEHGMSKEDIKRYNREYYLRTRKLVGRKAKQVQRTVDNLHTSDAEAKAARLKKIRARQQAQAKAARAERLAMQKRRLSQARAKAKRVKDPKKRGAIEKKLDSLESKFKAAFRKPKISRSKARPIGDFKPRNPIKGVKVSVDRPNLPDMPKISRPKVRATTGKIKVSRAKARPIEDFNLENPFKGIKVSRTRS